MLTVSLALPVHAQEALWKELIGKARTLYQQGHYAEAAKVAQEALEVAEKDLGDDHPTVAQSLNNLAVLYQAQGKYAEAVPLHKRALAIKEKALGPAHPNVATALGNMAGLYRETGRVGEAKRFEERAKAIRLRNQ